MRKNNKTSTDQSKYLDVRGVLWKLNQFIMKLSIGRWMVWLCCANLTRSLSQFDTYNEMKWKMLENAQKKNEVPVNRSLIATSYIDDFTRWTGSYNLKNWNQFTTAKKEMVRCCCYCFCSTQLRNLFAMMFVCCF